MITYILAHKSAQVNTNKEFMGARFTDIRGILTPYYVQNAKKGQNPAILPHTEDNADTEV